LFEKIFQGFSITISLPGSRARSADARLGQRAKNARAVPKIREFRDVFKKNIFMVSHFTKTFSDFSENHFQVSKLQSFVEMREFRNVSEKNIFMISHFPNTFSNFSENHFQVSESPKISLKIGNSKIGVKIVMFGFSVWFARDSSTESEFEKKHQFEKKERTELYLVSLFYKY